MSALGDFDFGLQKICDQCKMILDDSSSRSRTIDETLLKKVESAVEKKIISPEIGKSMIDHLEEFRAYKIGSLKKDDKEVIVSIFERALKDSGKRKGNG